MDPNEKTEPRDPEQGWTLPWWARVGLGTVALFLIFKYTPIMEILYLFTMIVMVPMGLMLALGLVTQGTYEGIANFIPSVEEDLMNRVRSKTETTTKRAAA